MPASRRIVIFGGSGQVGNILARHFQARGDQVTAIARNPVSAPWRTLPWNAATPGDWSTAVDGAHIVINLAGRSVNCRYNAENRREILESRLRTTSLVGAAIAQSQRPPAVWLNASTATIYRHSLDRAMDEDTGEIGGNEPDVPETWRFSIDVATSWEKAFFETAAPDTRKVALRSAMVMSPDPGGVFDVLLGLVRRGLGGPAGSGNQFVSWIHDRDFVQAVEFIIEHGGMDGPVNLSSPNPLPNGEFMRTLRQAWGIRFGLPARRWMLEIGAVFLKTETELVLKSRRVVAQRLVDAGFRFDFPEWQTAAANLVARWREGRKKAAQ